MGHVHYASFRYALASENLFEGGKLEKQKVGEAQGRWCP